jgi:hypothetical protein
VAYAGLGLKEHLTTALCGWMMSGFFPASFSTSLHLFPDKTDLIDFDVDK